MVNRTNICLKTFENYKDIKKTPIPTVYYNRNFNENLDLTVADFYWASSRKSYLPCGETCDVYSYDAIKNCILAGARVINLDIYADENGKMPVVRDQMPMPQFTSTMKTALDAEQCFKIIKNFAWTGSSAYPLIIYLTINTKNRLVLYNLTKMLRTIFDGRFINKKYSFSGRNGQYPFGQIPIRDLLGNVAIITDTYPTIGILDELINGTVDQNRRYINIMDYTESMAQYGGIAAVNSNTADMINNNKFNIQMINSVKNANMNTINNSGECLLNLNFRSPKSDLFNADPEDCWNLGCQMVLMNYQLYDANMEKYIAKFKNSGLVLKPDALRHIAAKPDPLSAQNARASFAPRKVGVQGWYAYNI